MFEKGDEVDDDRFLFDECEDLDKFIGFLEPAIGELLFLTLEFLLLFEVPFLSFLLSLLSDEPLFEDELFDLCEGILAAEGSEEVLLLEDFIFGNDFDSDVGVLAFTLAGGVRDPLFVKDTAPIRPIVVEVGVVDPFVELAVEYAGGVFAEPTLTDELVGIAIGLSLMVGVFVISLESALLTVILFDGDDCWCTL